MSIKVVPCWGIERKRERGSEGRKLGVRRKRKTDRE